MKFITALKQLFCSHLFEFDNLVPLLIPKHKLVKYKCHLCGKEMIAALLKIKRETRKKKR